MFERSSPNGTLRVAGATLWVGAWLLGVACWGVLFGWVLLQGLEVAAQQPAADPSGRPSPRPRPIAQAKPSPPQEGVLYVWQTPLEGPQTVLVLRVTGPDTADCAYLVPFRLKQEGLARPPRDAKDRADLVARLEALVGGHLVVAHLKGSDGQGQVRADVWLGQPKPGQPPPQEVGRQAPAPSGWLSAQMAK